MEPCPICACPHIGDYVVYATGWAKFCQGCGHRGPRAVLMDPMDDACRTIAEQDAAAQWNQAARSTTSTTEGPT